MNHDADVALTVKTVMAALQQNQTQVATGMGMSQSGLNRKMVGKSKWNVQDLFALSAFWGCTPADLLRGPTLALTAIIGKAPRQRERVGAA